MSTFTTRIPARGPDGNIFLIVGRATRMMRELDVPKEQIEDLYRRVKAAESYDAACALIEEWFPLEKDDDDD